MNTPSTRESKLIVNLTKLTPQNIIRSSNQNIKKKSVLSSKNDYELCTPKASIELTAELKKVLNEKNILTSKTRKRVFDSLDEIKTKTDRETRNFKREKALLEIVNSELKYIKQLELIITFFMVPVQERKLLNAGDYEILFGNIKTIYNINKELLDELDKGFDNVARAFSKIAPFLKLYSVYAYDFKNIIKLLQNARSLNPHFSKFLENQETRPEVQSKLSALLITPIQRVPRYKLLLHNLIEFTVESDTDYELLTECVEKINEAANHINKVVEEQENSQRLLELQRYLQSGELNIVVPGRKLKKEGILHKMSTKRNGHSEKLYVVLMNDIIIFNRMKKNDLSVASLKVHTILPLNKCKVTEILDKGCLKINCVEEELILYHDQFSEMVKWIENIENAIENYIETRKTLRKESSSRRPVKRKDVGEYHEVGVSPGRPLKKRRMAIEEKPPITPRTSTRISARRPIHSAVNSTPVKLISNPEIQSATVNGFNSMNLTFSNDEISKLHVSLGMNENSLSVRDSKLITKPSILKNNDNIRPQHNDMFVFGRNKGNDSNISKLGNIFKNFGTSIKGFFGFKNNE